MSRLLRLPLLARIPIALVSAILLIVGAVPVATYPFYAADARNYEGAIGQPARECPHDPIPAAGSCWSAAQARVTITGVDHTVSNSIAYLVLQVAGQQQVRENLLGTAAVPAGIDDGITVTVRFWGSRISQVLPPVDKGAAPIVWETGDNPSYRAGSFPTDAAVTAVIGLLGLLGFGLPLIDDVKRWRRRRQIEAEAELAGREALRKRELLR